jgi:hypothetical protein
LLSRRRRCGWCRRHRTVRPLRGWPSRNTLRIQPPQHVLVPVVSGLCPHFVLIPRAVVLPRPPQRRQVPAPSGPTHVKTLHGHTNDGWDNSTGMWSAAAEEGPSRLWPAASARSPPPPPRTRAPPPRARPGPGGPASPAPPPRGVHSSTFQLNASTLCW